MEVRVLGSPVQIHGKIAEGEFCNTYYGVRRDPAEALLLKVARSETLDPEEGFRALQREARILHDLQAPTSVRGSAYFQQFLPQVVTQASPGNVTGEDGFVGTANVFRFRSGFNYTYYDILRAYPKGVDARTGIWLWKRVLDMLGWLHEMKFAHANTTPQHILVHPRDHGSTLCGWSRVNRLGQPLAVRTESDRAFYPDSVWEGGPVTSDTDILMSARSMFLVLGGDPATGQLPDTVPEVFRDLIYRQAEENHINGQSNAWALLMEVDRVAKVVYGGSKFHPFSMPGTA